jgi:hypothetical protein
MPGRRVTYFFTLSRRARSVMAEYGHVEVFTAMLISCRRQESQPALTLPTASFPAHPEAYSRVTKRGR